MKKHYQYFAGILMLLSVFEFISCSKDKQNNPDFSHAVVINGSTYETTTIGSQVWTANDYTGPGGYSNASVDKGVKYFTRAQANAITLPSGWRVPTIADYNKLIHNFTSNTNFYGYYELFENGSAVALCATSESGFGPGLGTNASGFNASPKGYWQGADKPNPVFGTGDGTSCYITADATTTADKLIFFGVLINTSHATMMQFPNASEVEGFATPVRFVRDK